MRSRRKVVVGRAAAPSPRWCWPPAGGQRASSGGSGSGGGGGGAADANGVHNPSDAKGGTLRFANSGDWDSLDPADTYYAYAWNFVRLYGRSLMMFKSAPGKDGATLVPDLAESLGKPSDDAKTWTYTLRKGVKFEDGTPGHEQGRQVRRRAVAGQDDVPQRAHLLQRLPRPAGLHLARTRTRPEQAGPQGDRDPRRPDDRLPAVKPVQRLRLLRPAAGDDPGARGQGHRQRSTRSTWSPPARTCSTRTTSARASPWSATPTGTRPPTRTARRCPTGSRSQLNVNSDDIDNRLQAGDLDVDVEGTGVQPAAQGKILADQKLKANTDYALSPALWFTAINGDVAPLDNIHCRKAVQYAVDQTGYQRAYGGADRRRHRHQPPAAGDPGRRAVRPLPHAGNTGDVAKAKDELNAVRPAQRLHHEHLLPGRAAQGEGHGRGAAAVAGAGRAST